MGDTKVYPFSSPIIYEQKTEEEQNQYTENLNRARFDPLVVPADYRPVITTDNPIPGVSDDVTLNKPSISVIEIPDVQQQQQQQQQTPEGVTRTFQVKQGYWGTVFATAGIFMIGYFVYKKYFNKK